ncbi:MAG: GNAT family N-acetyltransferase [Pseudomonadota bacterium]
MILDQIVNQALIEADRISLRPVRRSDAGLLSMYAADKRVAWMTSAIPNPLPPGATEAFIDRAMADDRTEDVWVIDGSQAGHGEVLGTVGLKQMDRSQSEIGYWIAPAFWNTGLASEAVRAIIEANPHSDRTLFASVFQDNPASARVLTNAGFKYIGDAETFSVARNANVPTWTYILQLD